MGLDQGEEICLEGHWLLMLIARSGTSPGSTCTRPAAQATPLRQGSQALQACLAHMPTQIRPLEQPAAPAMEKMPALLTRTWSGRSSAPQASTNPLTDARLDTSSSMTYGWRQHECIVERRVGSLAWCGALPITIQAPTCPTPPAHLQSWDRPSLCHCCALQFLFQLLTLCEVATCQHNCSAWGQRFCENAPQLHCPCGPGPTAQPLAAQPMCVSTLTKPRVIHTVRAATSKLRGRLLPNAARGAGHKHVCAGEGTPDVLQLRYVPHCQFL